MLFLVILICLLFSFTSSKNYVFHLRSGHHIDILFKIGCDMIGNLHPYYICVKSNQKISTKHILTSCASKFGVNRIYEDKGRTRHPRFHLNDPDIQDQWYYFTKNPFSGQDYHQLLSHNLTSLWEQGITGKGIVVAVVDDGVDMSHTDLIDNFDPSASFNFVTGAQNPDSEGENHGTKCIGLISAVANNSRCGVGAAYGAKFGALRILSNNIGKVMDSNEAMAFSFRPDYIHIMTMSWGPLDDGKKIGRPDVLASRALTNGAIYGRNNLGTIYIYASGNGGRNFDFCGYDGYLQKPEIFVIGSIDEFGQMPPYAERCTAILASTLSNTNALQENKIYTTRYPNQCEKCHSGTSVSAPIAAALIALLLQTTPTLHRRDIQDLIIRTATQHDPYAKRNTAGHKYSLNFGFGLIEPHKLIAASHAHIPLPPLKICRIPLIDVYKTLPYGGIILSSLYSSGCAFTNHNISKIELIIITLNIQISLRSALSASLTSPSGTRVPILEPRFLDNSPSGLIDWDIKVMSFYGEPPTGVWKLEIQSKYGSHSHLVSWGISIYGHNHGTNQVSTQHLLIKSKVCKNDGSNPLQQASDWCNITPPPLTPNSIGIDPFAFYDILKVFGGSSEQSLDMLFIFYLSLLFATTFSVLIFFWIVYRIISHRVKYQRLSTT